MSSITKTQPTGSVHSANKTAASQPGTLDFVKQRATQVLGQLGLGEVVKKLQAEPPKVSDAIKSKDFKGVEWAFGSMSKSARLAALEELRQKDPKAYDSLLGAIRHGDIKDSDVTLPAGIDRLRNTEWAKTSEGKEVTAHVIGQYEKDAKDPWAADSRIAVGNTDGHTAKTEADTPSAEAGRNGKGVETSIRVSKAATSNPEVLAALLAHEGQHSLRNSKGSLKRELAEETDAHYNQSAVWKEFGDERKLSADHGADVIVKNFDEDAEYYQQDNKNAMMGHVAHDYSLTYTNHYLGKEGTDQDFKHASEIALDYLNANKRSHGRVFADGSVALRTDMWKNVILPLSEKTPDPTAIQKAYVAYNQ